MSDQQIFDRFAPFIRDFIYRSGWEELRPVQVATAQAVFDSDDDVLVTTGTASGKTEAAFLPSLSLINADPGESIAALYIGPLRALINDQFKRLEALCEKGNIAVHRWHGDVTAGERHRLLNNPRGVLQITPESIESLLINKTQYLRRIFRHLRFVVIDETHTFLNSDRGVQLACQLLRLEKYVERGRPRRIGLSATIGDAGQAFQWLAPTSPQQVRLVNPAVMPAKTRLNLLHLTSDAQELPPELADDVYRLTRNYRSLIFCNSRDEVERLTNKLNRRCERDRLDERYLPHHGSISKELREKAERRMQEKERPASVVCTSTMELGIDIGQLDLVVQVNSTASVSAFAQRLGRSGRRVGSERIMQIYSLEAAPSPSASFYESLPFSLLQALAVIDLFQEKWVEPPQITRRAYNVLYHQMLSFLAERNGATPRQLVGFFMRSGIFRNVTADDYETLLRHLVAINHIEQMADGTLIVGLAGEKVLRSRDFYAVFQSPPDWSVWDGTTNVGNIAPSPTLLAGDSLILGGRVWQVTEVLARMKKVIVRPMGDSQRTLFSASGAMEIHPRVGQRMRDLLSRKDLPTYLSQNGKETLLEARRLAQAISLDRQIIFEQASEVVLLPWVGTRAARALIHLLNKAGLAGSFVAGFSPWVITIKAGSLREIKDTLTIAEGESVNMGDFMDGVEPESLITRKFDEYLPEQLLRLRAYEDYFDFTEARRIVRNLSVAID